MTTKKVQNGRQPKSSKWKTTIEFKMKDNQKIQNGRPKRYGRQPKKIQMEDNQKNSRWKMTKINSNERRPKKIKIEDDQNKFKWKITKKIQHGRRPK